MDLQAVEGVYSKGHLRCLLKAWCCALVELSNRGPRIYICLRTYLKGAVTQEQVVADGQEVSVLDWDTGYWDTGGCMAGKSSTVIKGFVERGSIQASSLNIQCLRVCRLSCLPKTGSTVPAGTAWNSTGGPEISKGRHLVGLIGRRSEHDCQLEVIVVPC
jgi:hypothetical protein